MKNKSTVIKSDQIGRLGSLENELFFTILLSFKTVREVIYFKMTWNTEIELNLFLVRRERWRHTFTRIQMVKWYTKKILVHSELSDSNFCPSNFPGKNHVHVFIQTVLYFNRITESTI